MISFLTQWLEPRVLSLSTWQTIGVIVDLALKIIAVGIVPDSRKPSSSNAWLMAILFIPIVGLPLFLLMGGTYINRRRHQIQQDALKTITDVHTARPDKPEATRFSTDLEQVIALNRNLTRMPAVPGERTGFYPDYEESIRRMAAAVDQATSFVHVEIYIVAWDETTDVFFRACERAVQRGVTVRLLLDQVGSWKYPGYWKLGRRLDSIGVQWNLMLPLQPWRWRFRRPDLRNHRKLLVVDGTVGFMGSQNLIESGYLSKKNHQLGRHWVDVMVELRGPIVSSLQFLFAVDWFQETDEQLPVVEPPELQLAEGENIVQLVPSGPGFMTEPNLRMFNSLVHRARERLVLCSPYFIPDESLYDAVTTAAYRGVRVELLVNEESDQFMVGHAQSSYYQQLLEAGVHIMRYKAPAILHTKFMVADPGTEWAVGVMGSSNMDMRSFGLNYEVSLMVAQGPLLQDLADLTQQYLDHCTELTAEQWAQRSFFRRYVDNVCRLTSALQ